MKKVFLITGLAILALPKLALAHCPLCTAGAGALAVFAAYLGVSTIVVGMLIGAFSLALGLWISKLVKKKIVPHQDIWLTIVIYILTVVPIMPFIIEYAPLYISFGGEYGTLFHNTYTINLYILGAIIGIIPILAAPEISKEITKFRNGRHIPYQGVVISVMLLVIMGLLIQFLG